MGQALTDDQQQVLFQTAQSKPRWLFAYVAATLAFFGGLRPCEIRALQSKHVDWLGSRLQVRRSKTPAGWRDPSLNQACVSALAELLSRARAFGFSEPDHYVFPWHGRDKRLDPIRPMTSWRSAWRSLRKAAGLERFRFYDGRHTALTRLAEKGQPDWVIQAQMGHVSPAMMKTYSHIRRKALDEAAAVLEPTFQFSRGEAIQRDDDDSPPEASSEQVTSQSTSQVDHLNPEFHELLNESGSPHWTISATG